MRYKIIGFIFFIYALIFHASENQIHIVNLLITFLLIQYKKWQAFEKKACILSTRKMQALEESILVENPKSDYSLFVRSLLPPAPPLM